MNYKEIFYKQLSCDYNLSIDDILSDKNQYTLNKRLDGRSRYEWDDSALLKICVVNNKFIMCSYSEELLKKLKGTFDKVNPGFLGSFRQLEILNEILKCYNEKISDIHHYYLPAYQKEISTDLKVKFFDAGELFQFKGDERYKNALEFSSRRPDILGVGLYKGDELTALAAASKDSDTMWQIGINVNPEFRNMGAGAAAVNILKNEIIRRGILPFYGTVESHIASSKIALKCGFTPFFWRLYTKSITN